MYLWVVDGGIPNRITMYNADLSLPDAFSNGQAASLVLGQQDFTNSVRLPIANASVVDAPDYFVFDLAGNLWVADYCYNRVLRYSPPFFNGQAASLVLGKSDFTS